MKESEAVSVLGRTRLFGALDRGTLERIAAKTIARRYRRREHIFHQGDTGESLFILAEGAVKVYVTSEEGKEMVLATLQPGDTFGEMALIDEGPRSASAETLEATTALCLTRATFMDLVRSDEGLSETFYVTLGALLRRLLEQMSDLAFLDLPGRTAKKLLSLAQEQGQEPGPDAVINLKVSQTDLARMVGGSRPTVNQILKNFEARGYLELSGSQVLLKRPDLLQKRAAG
ncbi:MAG: Crp/Fnr family transcriptional regulator [Actinomycetota bacterium]